MNGLSSTPIMPVGLGASSPTLWIAAEYGNFLDMFCTGSQVSLVFNLDQPLDVDAKILQAREWEKNGVITKHELAELEERVRTACNLGRGCRGGSGLVAINRGLTEGVKYKKGQTYYTYSDGKKVAHTAKGPRKTVSAEQKKAAENARKYAHTPEAEKKRRKSIAARGEEKSLGI